MAKRLVKVAKELNVGTSTIVEHLTKSGFEIENKPTAKVTEEMENVLLQEFSKSMAIKEKADSLVIGSGRAGQQPGAKKELPPLGGLPPLPPKPKEELPKLSDLPKAPVREEAAEPVAPKAEAPKTETPVDTPAPKVEAKVEPTKAPAPTDDEVDEEEEERPSRFGLKVKGKIDLDAVGKKPAKKKEEPKPDEPKVEAPKVETPAVEAKEAATADSAPTEKESAEKPAAAKEKPAEQTPAQKDTSAPKAPNRPVDLVNEAPSDPSKTIRAEAPELRGLKIQGKIDISKLDSGRKKKKKDEKPVAGAAGANDPNKRKRKRKKIIKVQPGQPSAGGRGTTGSNRGAPPRGGRGKTKEPEVKEVSQKEIEDKIRATMARIQGGGNKKKRQKMRRDNRDRHREKEEARLAEVNHDKLEVTEFISVQELANIMEINATDVITTCMNVGVIVGINQRLDAEIIELVASEFDREVEFISAEEAVEDEDEIIDAPEDLRPRSPIVTVMGHVDHGKTSLLDYIRKANVADGEAGGITQHIGAYEVPVQGDKRVTFLDTPGHEAFTAMRARGAKVTDIAVIIVAADDQIMPQTKEAISHAQAAGVPIVFAINKIDKDGANPERIKGALAEMNLMVEEWGGKIQSQDISAKTGENIDLLLEKILLEAELLELQANPNRNAVGSIIEASLDKGRGYVSKILVTNGTLKIGDPIIAGEHSGRVKAMYNELGKKIKTAGPATPVLVLGLGGAPQAGEGFKSMDSESDAKQLANRRSQIVREQTNRARKRISLDEIGRRLALGTFKELNLIVKGDVDGSVEALSDSLIKLGVATVQVNVIHKAVGQIIESDILLASASDAIVIGFQVRPSLGARRVAEAEGVEIKTYSIIYEAIEEIKAAIEGMLEPTKEEKIVGQVQVREIYKISKIGTIAGCYVQEGKVNRNHNIRLVRDGIVVYPTKEGAVAELGSLKRYKEDIKEVKAGMECGLTIKNFNDIKVDDVVETFEIVEIKQTLD